MKNFFIFFVMLASPSVHLFSAIQDFNKDKKHPKQIITLTIPAKTTKTTWETVQENKVRTAVGTYTGILALLAPIAIIERNYNDNQQKDNLLYASAGTIILAGLSYYLLQPLFSEESDETTQEQNNNQH